MSGEEIQLSGAVPDAGWHIGSWTGTDDGSKTADTNSLTMPASARSASVSHVEIASVTGWVAYNDCVSDPTEALAA